MIPSRLIECPIEEATVVVNARGEVVNADYVECSKVLLVELSWGKNTRLSKDQLHNACLTPCKPKPVFVEAVALHGIYKIGDCAGGHRKYVELQHAGSAVYFTAIDLSGIESIPPEQLEIVLRRKVSE